MSASKNNRQPFFFGAGLLQLLLFCSAPSSGQVVYTDLEPYLYIPTPDRKDKTYKFDIDNDSNFDFGFSYDDVALSGYIYIIPYNHTEFIGPVFNDYIAFPDTLSYNDPIDESRNWTNRTDLLLTIVEHIVTMIDCRLLKKGIYIVRIRTREQWIAKKVMIG